MSIRLNVIFAWETTNRWFNNCNNGLRAKFFLFCTAFFCPLTPNWGDPHKYFWRCKTNLNYNNMELEEILKKPLWQMTGEEFMLLSVHTANSNKDKETHAPQDTQTQIKEKRQKYVYGLPGIAELFGCSVSTAQKIKNSGRIDKAIHYVGPRKIIVDAELAIELVGRKGGIQ